MPENRRPRTIVWQGPEGWTVLATEDGVEIRSRSGDGLEPVNVKRLVSVLAIAEDAFNSDQVPAPRPPEKADTWESVRANFAREAIDAINTITQPDPF